MKTIQANRGGITAILTKGFKRHCIVNQYLVENPEEDVMVWGTNGTYFPCKRKELYYGVNLIQELEDSVNDFSTLIVDTFYEQANSFETKKFIKYIKNNSKFKNKKFILLFVSNSAVKENVEISNFQVYFNVLNKCSDYIYSFSEPCWNSLILKDVDNEKTCKFLVTDILNYKMNLVENS